VSNQTNPPPEVAMRAAALSGVALIVAACGVDPLTTRVDLRQAEFRSVDRVEVVLDAGDVEVIAGNEVAVESRLRWTGFTPPALEMRRVGATLVVSGSCGATTLVCVVDVYLTLPPEVLVEVFTEVGDVSVQGMDGDLFVDTGGGVVELTDLSGRVDATTDSGDIVGRGLSTLEIEVQAASGDIEAEMLDDRVHVDASTGSGNIEFEVPAGAYELNLWTVSGEVELSNVEEASAAAGSLTAVTQRGDVRITGQ
jgi:hypothetical protein